MKRPYSIKSLTFSATTLAGCVLLSSCATNPYPAMMQENQRRYDAGEISRREYRKKQDEYTEKNAEFTNQQFQTAASVVSAAGQLAEGVGEIQQGRAMRKGPSGPGGGSPSGPSGGGSPRPR